MSDRHLWRGFQEIVGELGKHGVPRPSDPWMEEVERFYLHPTALVWIACVGRAGGKNLVGILCDLTELIFGEWNIPPGEKHYQVTVGENRTEAEKTLRQMAQYFGFLNIPHGATADTIDLGGDLSDRGAKVLACRIGAVSGFRSTGLTVQESAKWSNDGVNPAGEIWSSAVAQTVTHRARKRSFATPLGRAGFFFAALTRGDNETQIVTRGPSWKFNPTITEEATHALEPDERVWRREYLAEPQDGALGAFDSAMVDAAIRDVSALEPLGRPTILTDLSSGGGDATTFCAAVFCAPRIDDPNEQWVWKPVRDKDGVAQPGDGMIVFDRHGVPVRQVLDEQGRPVVDPAFRARQRTVLVLHSLNAIEGRFAAHVPFDEGIARIAHLHRTVGARGVVGDQHDAHPAAGELARRHRIPFTKVSWTNPRKYEAVLAVRRWFRDGTIAIEPGEQATKLRSELLAFSEKITPSGTLKFEGAGQHDDRVSLLLLAAAADAESLIEGSPYRKSRERHVLEGRVPSWATNDA